MFKLALNFVLNIACYLIVARALISWFIPSMGGFAHQIYKSLETLTDPIMAPFVLLTRGLAQRTGLDLSPLFALITLQYLSSIVAKM